MNHRIRYLHRLNKEAGNLHKTLSLGKETLSLYYLNNIIDSLENIAELQNIFKKRLKESKEEEIQGARHYMGPM